MRKPWDARRSLQRYVAEVLGADWTVALEADRGEFGYPFARVQAVGDLIPVGPALYVDVSQPMSIQCYPEPALTATESQAAAAEVLDRLERSVSAGFGKGRPRRIPLYDFDGVPLHETSYARDARDFLQVVDFSARTLPDPEEARNVAVVADVRVRWRRPGGVPFGDTQPVEEVRTGFAPI